MPSCTEMEHISKPSKKTKVIAIAKPGKDTSMPESFRSISFPSPSFKLCHRLLLQRLNPIAEPMLIQEQAGFRPGKDTTGHLLNPTQHVENGYQKNLITSVVSVDLSAASDRVNPRRL